VQTEKSGTLGTGNDQTLFCMATQQGGLVRRAVDCRNGTESEVNGTLQAKESGCSLNLNNVVRESLFVRRLTPLECTRLQGFPDNWVNLGDWTDSKGKRHKEADAPKYKALGNSIALPYWRWMTRRMARYLPEHATLGSLFDGIGGFPLVWQETHGDYTARWASEIEEFPMAVTKLRFPEPETKEEE
jgi:DNA (cytosine-5)-methyltransferase 1